MVKRDRTLSEFVAAACALTVMNTVSTTTLADETYPEGAGVTAFVPEDRPYTRSEARDVSFRDANGNVPVVLHYGADIWGADALAEALRRGDGIAAFALAGGRAGEVELFVNGERYGRFTQDDLNGVILSGAAYRAHSIEANGVDPYERQ